MCRLAAFPPGYSRDKAIDILLNFEDFNTDGTGYSYVKDGEFVVEKWAKSLSKVLKQNDFLTHMPYDGWTIAHLRAASHGEKLRRNTHPFVTSKYCICHNGIWSDYKIAKLALKDRIEFKGETDSEVAAQLIDLIGPAEFAKEMDFAGTYLVLQRDGKLWALKTSGDLEMKNLRKGGVLIASEFDDEMVKNAIDVCRGWFFFDNQGHYLDHEKTGESYSYIPKKYHVSTCATENNCSSAVKDYSTADEYYRAYGSI